MNPRPVLAVVTSVAMLLPGCGGGGAPPPAAEGALDVAAEAYVRLVLAVGRHDDLYVDAYHGPPQWKAEAEAGEPAPLARLLERTHALLEDVRRAEGPADRKRFLEKQLIAVEAHVRQLSGESMTLTEECRLLYDADPPRHEVAEFAAAHRELERLAPGSGPLAQRVETMRAAVYIPRDRLAAALDTALGIARTATASLISLPPGERFEAVLVSDKPWGAYNWYLGDYRSRIELNADLPVEANSLLSTMCHEGYPGHHLYNALVEQELVKGRGWIEYSVYPLYSPQSLIAEGTANAAMDILFSDDERRRALTDVLAPIAGVSRQAVLAMDRIRDARRPLRYVSSEAARMLLDEGKPEAEVIAFIRTWAMTPEARAERSVRFARTYRSYVFNYTLGEDIVREWIGDGPDRRERFFDLLSRPVVPSDLRGRRSPPPQP